MKKEVDQARFKGTRTGPEILEIAPLICHIHCYFYSGLRRALGKKDKKSGCWKMASPSAFSSSDDVHLLFCR